MRLPILCFDGDLADVVAEYPMSQYGHARKAPEDEMAGLRRDYEEPGVALARA
jgi:hypothetical protein